jgi:chemotaxis protein CheD
MPLPGQPTLDEAIGGGWNGAGGMPARAPLPPVSLADFGHIQRYFDPKMDNVTAKILPGQYYVTTADELVTTVLGSCVAACIWDPEAGVGGMNHFMIPGMDQSGAGDNNDSYGPARYGLFAMEFLINAILKCGARRERLLVKLAGGGQVVRSRTPIGQENVAFARQYLEDERFQLVGEHVEGDRARRLVFHPLSGRSKVLELSPVEYTSAERDEERYARKVEEQPEDYGDIELF